MEDEKDKTIEATEEKQPDKTVEEILAEKQAEWEKETDRRVSEAITKREQKLKEEQAEKDRLANLSAEEKFNELEKTKQEEIAKRERTIEARELKLTLFDILKTEELDTDLADLFELSKYAGMENKDETLKVDVQKAKAIIQKLVDKQVESLKAELLKGETPAKQKTEGTEFKKAQKNGSVLDMIKAKL